MTLHYSDPSLDDTFNKIGPVALNLEMVHYAMNDRHIQPYHGGFFQNLHADHEGGTCYLGRVIDSDATVRLVNENNYCDEACSIRTATLATFLFALYYVGMEAYETSDGKDFELIKLFEDTRECVYDFYPDVGPIIRFLD